MKQRLARELLAVSEGLKECISFSFNNIEPKKADFVSAICAEIEDLADRVRRNEGLSMSIERQCGAGKTLVRIMMTDHEALDAVRQKMADRLGKMGRKKQLDIKVGG